MLTSSIKSIKDWVQQHPSHALLLLGCLAKLLIHFLMASRYGFHRDEFLYLAMGDHLAWGYQSVPPMIGLLGFVSRTLFGDSLLAARIFPAVAGTLSLWLTGQMLILMGGKSRAMAIMMIAMILSPAFLRSNWLFQPVTFNQLVWVAAGFCYLQWLKTDRGHWWLWLGGIFGIGILTKYTVLLVAASMVFATLVSARRGVLLTRWPWLGGLIAGTIAMPNLVWQITHNFPLLWHMRVLAETQLVYVDHWSFLMGQLIAHLPVFWVWLGGLIWLLTDSNGRRWRPIGVTALAVVALLLVTNGKSYYAMGVYPWLFAAGGIAWSTWLGKWGRAFRLGGWLWLLGSIIWILPWSAPVLEIHHLSRYGAWMRDKVGFDGPLIWENGRAYTLPQDFADMLGWEELTEGVKKAYDEIPEEARAEVMVFAENYGLAGAITHLGRKYHLPPAISFHGSFFYWSPDSISATALIYVNDEIEDIAPWFGEIRQIDMISDSLAREFGRPVWLCLDPNPSFWADWPAVKVRERAERGHAVD
ncbi:glycosyltransferase family 39 protein [Pontibacter sp. G13]|uniref:glycosyltransferase family 39 protein n=1 Tax=Pontibacter sp. G13 TaxID=3074898 RepID=UPI00288A79E4|nr:glycosyltransferase family 39 protein [Pontibacter sp. G13]WNJ20756.1 glycosyltransferase family 39 protein [Pontibacter sp. G13]